MPSGLSVTPGGGGSLRLIRVDVTPRRTGPALIAGQMWIDSATAEVVRLTFRYVGTGLWVRPDSATRSDSSSARRINSLANQIVSIDADLEYGLQDARYWMPRRQVISGRVRIPLVSDVVIPFRAVTTFEDFEINTGRPIAFDAAAAGHRRSRLPAGDARGPPRLASRGAPRRRDDAGADSLRSWSYADRWAGGRYELHRPSNDSLGRFDGLARLALARRRPGRGATARERVRVRAGPAGGEHCPIRSPAGGRTGSRTSGSPMPFGTIGCRGCRSASVIGCGCRVWTSPALYGTARYGFSDDRVTGRLSLVRDAPDGRLIVSGYRDVVNVDPFAPAPGIGNTLNALFVAHDDGDYALVHGGSAGYETSLRTGLELAVGARYERQTSVAGEASSEVNDFLGGSGVFPPNAPVDEGRFVGGHVRLSGTGDFRWQATADVLGGEGDDHRPGLRRGAPRAFGQAPRV